MNGMISVAPLPHSCTPQPYIPATVDKMAAGTELDVVEAPVALESCSSPPQTYPGCYGLPYQDHNYGAPPPLSPTVITPVEIDPVIETAIESATVTIETSNTEPNEAVVDDSITRCICDFTHDDGYMICCDQCSVWQHIDCMGIDRNKIPETYCCELCDPRPYDKERAMAIQAQKKQEMTDGSSSEEEKLLSAYTAISGRTPTSITLKQKHKANTGEKKRKRRDSKAIERTEKRQQKRIKKEKIEKPIDVKANKKTKDGAKKPVNKKLPNVIVDDDNACDSWDAAQRAWTDTYEEAKSNQYSPDIEAVLALNSLNGAHWAEPSLSKQLQVQLCKVAFIQNDKRGLLTTSNVAMYQTIIEFKGSFMQRNQFDVENTFYKVEHPYVLFYNKCDHMDLCIDATKYGNDARFVRRSCTPNAEVRHVVDSGSMSLFICSTKDMQAETEVTIPFDFNYRDCNYCVECACNRANCSVKKFFKKSKTKENDVPVKKKRTKSQETMELEDSPTAGSVTLKTKKVSPLKISIPPSPTINVNGDSNPSTMAVETTTPDAPLTTPAPKTPTGSSTGTHATAPVAETSDTMDPDEKKMTREERKMLAIMRAFEKLEKREERRKEALARLEHKKPNEETDHEEVKEEVEVHEEQEKGEEPVAVTVAPVPEKVKEVTAKKRKTKSNSTPARRRSRMHSGGSSTAYQSTDDESNHASAPVTPTPCDSMNTSQSVKSFRFHKTKKHLMTEWLMEKGFDTPKPLSIRTDLPEEPSDSAEFVKCIPSPHNSWNHLRRDSTQHPQLTVVRQASLDSSMGSAKKRWLRQAISETTSTTDSGNSSPVQNGNISPSMPSPSCSPPPDFVTPLKKRRMARESLTSQDGLLTHLVTPSTPVFNTDQTDGQLKVEKVVPEGKNGLKPYSPVTPLSPSHFGENLFEKFNKGGCTFGDEKLLKLASVESDVSDSILTCFKSEKIEMKPEAPLITVTSCDLKNTGLETIDESDPASISSQHVTGTLVKCEETGESCGQSRVDVKETTSATDSDSGVKSSSTENKNKLLGDAVAQGFESEPVSRLECTDDVLSETKVKDQLLSDCGSSYNSVSFINVTDPIQSGVNDSLLLQVDVAKAVTNETAEELPVASRSINKEMNLGSPCRLQQLPAGVNTSSRLTVATDSMSPEKNSEAPSVTSTIPFGPKGYVSLSERLASLSPAEKQPAMPVQPTSNVDIAVPPNAAVTEHSQADLMPSSSGQTTGSREQEISSPEKHLMSPTQSSSSSAERGQMNMQSASSSDSGLSVNIPTIGPATTDLSPNTSCPTTPVCGTPPIKKKVSLSEYRKRLKDKTSSNNTPIKVSSLASFSVNSPIATAPTLPSLPLFTRVTPSKDQDADRARKEVEASWQPRENKPLSLMERLKKEFGVDADDEERLEAASGTASTIESATYQSNITGPASGGKIPSLLSLPSFPHTPYHQGGPQPIPPPPPPSLNSSSYKQLSGQQGQTFSTGSAKIPSLLNGVYNLPGQAPRHAPSQSLGNGQSTVQNGPTQPSRIHYNHALGKQQYYKR